MEEPTAEYQLAKERFGEFLKSKKKRCTQERFEILRHAMLMKAHFDVEELYMAVEKDGYHVSRSTVYNTVEVLCEAGILQRHLFVNRQAQYEIAQSNHFHLICNSCGKIKEVKDDEVMRSLVGRKYTGFTQGWFAITVYGTCSACNRKRAKMRKEAELANHSQHKANNKKTR